MASTGAQRTHVRLAAALLASLLVAFVVLTYLSYTAAFSPTDTVTLTAPRAGLEMDRGNKVKYRGIQIGKVDDISYAGEQAQLTLAIDGGELHYIPSNAAVHIASSTVFVFRRRDPTAPRPYRVWGYPVVPALFVLASAILLYYTFTDNLRNSALGSLVILSGVPIFYFFARRRKRIPAYPLSQN